MSQAVSGGGVGDVVRAADGGVVAGDAHDAARATFDAARAMFEADVASRSLGIELVDTGPGTATARMRVTASMLNGHQIMHGGYLFLLADTTFACACNSHGPVTVAAGADISFTAPVRQGAVLTAVATERARYGRSGIYDVTVYRDAPGGRVTVAEFRGRSRTIGREGAAGQEDAGQEDQP